MNLCNYNCQPKSRQEGFVLPLVLVAIAALAIITLAAYRSISNTIEILDKLRADTEAARALQSAEAEATFVFLTSASAPGGLITQPEIFAAFNSVIDTTDPTGLSPSEFWQATGARRISTASALPVEVTYFDAAGAAPIGVLPVADLVRILTASGFDSTDAQTLAARIADYQDSDVRRQLRGAERAEYRLFGEEPPTNSPIRVYSELDKVLGFSDIATSENWIILQDYMRFGGRSSQFKTNFSIPKLTEVFSSTSFSAVAGTAQNDEFGNDILITNSARFLLRTLPDTGLTRLRAVEIMRTPNAADAPFRREWLYDKVEQDAFQADKRTEDSGLATVFAPAAGAD